MEDDNLTLIKMVADVKSTIAALDNLKEEILPGGYELTRKAF